MKKYLTQIALIAVISSSLNNACFQISHKTYPTKAKENILTEKKTIEDKSFEEFLLLFPDVSTEKFIVNQIGVATDFPLIEDSLAVKYFHIEIEELYEGCQNIKMQAVARFFLPGKKHIAIITKELVCPIANIYEEYPMYVFDLQGNLLTEYKVAYARGDSEGMTYIETTIENGIITKNITEWWQEWEGEDEEYPVVYDGDQILEVRYNPITNKFDEKEILE